MSHTELESATTNGIGFALFTLAHGKLAEVHEPGGQSTLSAWTNDALQLPAGATHFGFVQAGPAHVTGSSGEFTLTDGMYFALPGPGVVAGPGQGIVVSRGGYHGFFGIGGPIEPRGRLRYIDGCTDSLLISPVVLGDPCLNLLYIPPHTHQSSHTHPSVRMGLIVRGQGTCETPSGAHDLSPGQAFVISAGGQHSFHTADSGLTVIAYHPDSDFGPHDDDHPMLNRTFLTGR